MTEAKGHCVPAVMVATKVLIYNTFSAPIVHAKGAFFGFWQILEQVTEWGE